MKDFTQLKVASIKNKQTNKWLAEQFGFNQATVSKWCTNTAGPIGNTEANFRIAICQSKRNN